MVYEWRTHFLAKFEDIFHGSSRDNYISIQHEKSKEYCFFHIFEIIWVTFGKKMGFPIFWPLRVWGPNQSTPPLLKKLSVEFRIFISSSTSSSSLKNEAQLQVWLVFLLNKKYIYCVRHILRAMAGCRILWYSKITE